MKREIILLRVIDRKNRVVAIPTEAYRVNLEFAVHRMYENPKLWTYTHTESGLRGRYYRTRKEALQALRYDMPKIPLALAMKQRDDKNAKPDLKTLPLSLEPFHA